MVVVLEKLSAEGPGVGDAAESFRECRAVLQGLESGLGVRVVVGDVRSAVGAGHAQLGEEHGDGF
jgi:hypothetical protein